MAKIKPAGKIAIVLGLAGLMFGGYKMFGDQLIPEGKQEGSVAGLMSDDEAPVAPSEKNKCLQVGVVTWGGYAGGQYWNGGFKNNPSSRYKGVCVDFTVMDDFDASRAAFKAGKMDLMWVTMDAFPTEAGAMGEPVKFLFQADWSRGGDAIVAKSGINSIADLAGKTVAVAEATPSHTFLLWMLDSAGMSPMDVNLKKFSDTLKAGESFKSGQVDAAVVWSPDDAACVNKVGGSKIIVSTKQATHIIADGFMVKQSVLNARKPELKALVEGWLQGAAEINASVEAKNKAGDIVGAGLGIPAADAISAIDNVRLATYGDNLKFFGLKSDESYNTGESLYDKMSKVYGMLNLADNVPEYASVIDIAFISSLDISSDDAKKAEEVKTFAAPTKTDQVSKAVSSKPVSVTFEHGQAKFDLGAQSQLNIRDVMKFIDSAKAFPGSRIRIEGNTDSTGSSAVNTRISQERAQSVVQFLVSKGMEPNRFVVVGNGPNKPLCSDSTPDCMAKNRRTDFQILEN